VNADRSIATVAVSESALTAFTSEKLADREIALDALSPVPSLKLSTVKQDSDGFQSVACRNLVTTSVPLVITLIYSRQPLLGVRKSASLPIISKKEMIKALLVSSFIPPVTAQNIEKFLKDQLSL
jgi:hypothetical protein